MRNRIDLAGVGALTGRDLLFRASSAAALEIAADPKHLGAEIGIISVLHTWGQNLLLVIHLLACRPSSKRPATPPTPTIG